MSRPLTFGRAIYVPLVTMVIVIMVGIPLAAHFGVRFPPGSGYAIGVIIGIAGIPWVWSRLERSE